MGLSARGSRGGNIGAYLLSVKSLEELTEVSSRVVGARRGLRMVLNTEGSEFSVSHSFDGAVIEVKVRHLK